MVPVATVLSLYSVSRFKFRCSTDDKTFQVRNISNILTANSLDS